jgi:hypothetical protein
MLALEQRDGTYSGSAHARRQEPYLLNDNGVGATWMPARYQRSLEPSELISHDLCVATRGSRLEHSSVKAESDSRARDRLTRRIDDSTFRAGGIVVDDQGRMRGVEKKPERRPASERNDHSSDNPLRTLCHCFSDVERFTQVPRRPNAYLG